MPIKGIDVAKYQPTNPDPANLAGISFYIAKATHGTTQDPTYALHIKHAREQAIPLVMAYHFGVNAPVLPQVNAFLSVAGKVDGYALDNEGPNQMTTAQKKEFLRLMHERGHLLIGYASESGYLDYGQDIRWVANYSREPNIAYDIWQYGPYAPNVDGNIFPGTLAELKKLLGVDVAQADITNTDPKMVTFAGGNWYDLDGKTVISDGHGPLPSRLSPYGVGAKRAIYVHPSPTTTALALIIPSSVQGLPVVDCTKQVVDAVNADRAKAHIVTHPDTIEY